jgi:hypothetical protein
MEEILESECHKLSGDWLPEHDTRVVERFVATGYEIYFVKDIPGLQYGKIPCHQSQSLVDPIVRFLGRAPASFSNSEPRPPKPPSHAWGFPFAPERPGEKIIYLALAAPDNQRLEIQWLLAIAHWLHGSDNSLSKTTNSHDAF